MASKIRALVTEARWRGLWGTVRAIKLNKMGTMHCLVGEDEFKNRYFEDKTEWYGRDRWVEYVDDRNPDSLKVTPDWHAWLHHNTDATPTLAPLPQPAYKGVATGNLTGTSDAYIPSHHRLHQHPRGPAPDSYEPWNPGTSSRPRSDPDPRHPSSDVLDLK